MRAVIVIGLGLGLVAASTPAWAARPVLTGEATFGAAGGEILVHYATTGRDAVRATDADGDGVPDFVAEVATTAELALQHFIALGFRRPLADGVLGGDGRIDIYLRDLNAADGNAGLDPCDGDRCAGYVSSDNDFTGYAYATLTEGIRSVVPHEIFHLVQDAYSIAQPATWTEGSAVWSVENLYGTGNSDFERFLPSFVERSYRPFERAVGGFGDSYPYGAALWPYFLEQRFGVGAVVAAWAASEHAELLDAVDTALVGFGSTMDAAWTELTRWNAFTGARATGGAYPDATAWPEVPREPVLSTTATIYVEGLSARYVPIRAASRAQLTVTATGGIHVVTWVVRDGGTLEDGVELTADGAALATTIDAGSYTLVVTGLSRNTVTTAVALALVAPPPAEPVDGGCAATPRSGASSLLVVLAALAWARRRAGYQIRTRWSGVR